LIELILVGIGYRVSGIGYRVSGIGYRKSQKLNNEKRSKQQKLLAIDF